MILNDDRYEDEAGQWTSRSEIDCLGTYKHSIDGFFTWCCGNCKKEVSTRAFRIAGTVWTCRNNECKKKNLLVRTDIRFVEQKLQAVDRNDGTAEQAIKKALTHIGLGISALGQGIR